MVCVCMCTYSKLIVNKKSLPKKDLDAINIGYFFP